MDGATVWHVYAQSVQSWHAKSISSEKGSCRVRWKCMAGRGSPPEHLEQSGYVEWRSLMDIVSREKRSAMMSNIKAQNTRPEIAVRRVAHRLGLRFRLHRRDLPGSPDIVFPRWHTALFVHGCYWHRHSDCKFSTIPKSNVEFWQNKLQGNVDRDVRVRRELETQGWNVVVIWECQTRSEFQMEDILSRGVRDARR